MNKLIIPPSSNWYESCALACAPDNTIVYGARNEIVVIFPKPPEEPADVKIIGGIHTQKVVGVVVNPGWGNPSKLAVSVAEDNVVRLLDIETCRSKLAQVGHTTRSDKVVGATFAGDDKVVSVSEDGFIIVWRLGANHLTSISDILGSKAKVTCVSSCPHASWMIAFGLKRGTIVITDLRKSGKVMYRLSGHDSSIISLSWCPAPFNIFPKKVKKAKEIKSENPENKTENNVTGSLEVAGQTLKLDDISQESDCDKLLEIVNNRKTELDETCDSKENCLENRGKLEEETLKEQALSSQIITRVQNSTDTVASNAVLPSEPSECQLNTDNEKLEDNKESQLCSQTRLENRESELNVKLNSVEDQNDVKKQETQDINHSSEVSNKEFRIASTASRGSSEPSECQLNIDNEKLEDKRESQLCGQSGLENGESELNVKLNPVEDQNDVKKQETQDINHSSEVSNKEFLLASTARGGPSDPCECQLNTDNETLEDNKESQLCGQSGLENGESELNVTLNPVDDQNVKKQETQDINHSSEVPNKEFLLASTAMSEPSEHSERQLNTNNEKLEDKRESQLCGQSGLENGESELNVKLNPVEDQNDAKRQETQDINLSSEVSNREFLLASTARGGGTIKIWRAGTDGFLQTELYIPGKPRSSRSNRSEDKSWIAICWVTPKDLLSSSHKGELLHWKFPFQVSADGKVNRWRLVHGDHHKHIFCIAAPTKIYDSLIEENWRNRCPFNAWTMGKDRFILNTSLNADRKTLALYPTIGGTISCMAASRIDPSRIALATGEGTCRTWDLSRSHLQHIVMTQLSDKTQIKITSLAWHPSKEVCLAFGTLDGRVGLIDTNNTTKGIKFLVQSCHGSVYKVEWGPLNGDPDVLGLYAVSSGSLLAYDIGKPLHEPTKVDFEENCVTHFAWKPDYSLLAVGTKTGDVMLYSTKLKLRTTLLLQNKGVRWMIWHPAGPEDSWLAVSTNHVIVYDCSSVNENSTKQTNYEKCTVAIFTEHTHYVQCLAWSPHEGGLLASASEDGTALVWNVKTKTLLHSCITNNRDMLNTVLWSPLDPDYIITGGRDCMIQIWKLSENPPKPKIEKKVKHKVLKLEGDEEIDNADAQKTGGVLKKPRKYLLVGIAQTQNPNFQSALLEDCERLFAFLYENTKNECPNGPTDKKMQFDALQLFGSKDDIDTLLQLEKTCHQKKKVPLYHESIALWQGNIGETIKKAITEGTLNAHLVAVAPMISFSLWQEACEAYANQLSEAADSRPVEAAYFYLACHKVQEAIEALCNASYYREALILAKCRLQAGDPLIDGILERWAKFCTTVGNFEVTAQCYIALNRLEDATKSLFRRSDIPTLKFCTKLAEHSNNKDLLEATQFRLNAFSQSEPVEENELQWELVPRGELELIRNSQRNLAPSGEHDVPDNVNSDIKSDMTGSDGTEPQLAGVSDEGGGGDIFNVNNDPKLDVTGNQINGTESKFTGDGQPVIDLHDE